MAASAPILDLFGYVAPASAKGNFARRKQTPDKQMLEEFEESFETALAWLEEEVSEAIRALQMRMVDLVEGDATGEVDCLLESLDDELTHSIREVRRKVLW